MIVESEMQEAARARLYNVFCCGILCRHKALAKAGQSGRSVAGHQGTRTLNVNINSHKQEPFTVEETKQNDVCTRHEAHLFRCISQLATASKDSRRQQARVFRTSTQLSMRRAERSGRSAIHFQAPGARKACFSPTS